MDVTGAFLYGEIKENIYVKLPEGAYSGKNNIVKLNKSLYGLKISPKCWNSKFNYVMSKEGFLRSKCDPCLFKKYNGNDRIFLLLYVDDILLFGTNKKDVLQVKDVLHTQFDMKDLGLLSKFLGINVKQNLKTGVTELDQIEYLKNVRSKFNMENCKTMSTPIDPNLNTKIFVNDSNIVDESFQKQCRQIIGCLMYAASGTRSDLCFTISMLSRYQKCANNELLSALKRVLRYIKYTLNYKLINKCSNIILEGYCDADWGGDVKDRKSTSG